MRAPKELQFVIAVLLIVTNCILIIAYITKYKTDVKGSVIDRINDNATTRSSTTKIASGTNSSWHKKSETTTTKCTKTLAMRRQSSVNLVDFSNKLKIMGTPKGGATVATQIMFRKIGLLETALKYNPWIHNYRCEVYNQQFQNMDISSSKLCHLPGWVCVKLVRSPLDRVVSSYIHVMKTPVKHSFPELKKVLHDLEGDENLYQNASFFHFVTALDLRNQTHWQSDHYEPQLTKDSEMNENNIFLVPVESLEDALLALEKETGMTLNATGFTSNHYIKKDNTLVQNMQNVPHTKWPSVIVDEVTHEERSPPYGAYLLNTTLNRKICQLYCHDIRMYAKACGSAWLRQSDATQLVCQAEKERLIAVCGEDYDFF